MGAARAVSRGATGRAARGPGRPRVEGLADRRREEILEGATRVFARSGYPGTDVQVVADLLGVGKGTVYRYFPTKESLFLAAADRGMRLLRTRVETDCANEAHALNRIRCAIRSYLSFFDEHPEIVELIVQERAEFRDRKKPTYFQHRDANIGPWRSIFRELMASGSVREVPIDRITDVISDLLYGTIFTNYFSGRRKSIQKQVEDVLDILEHGILNGGKS